MFTASILLPLKFVLCFNGSSLLDKLRSSVGQNAGLSSRRSRVQVSSVPLRVIPSSSTQNPRLTSGVFCIIYNHSLLFIHQKGIQIWGIHFSILDFQPKKRVIPRLIVGVGCVYKTLTHLNGFFVCGIMKIIKLLLRLIFNIV